MRRGPSSLCAFFLRKELVMKAVVIDRYNKNDLTVSVREIPAPVCGENDVLVHVC